MSRSAPAPKNPFDHDAAVAKGAAFLDAQRLSCTTRWRNYVDPGRLDMGRWSRSAAAPRDLLCQLGTTHEVLGITEEEAVEYGFDPVIDDRDHANALTAAWLRLLAADETKQVA
jgi:hypothetical protein